MKLVLLGFMLFLAGGPAIGQIQLPGNPASPLPPAAPPVLPGTSQPAPVLPALPQTSSESPGPSPAAPQPRLGENIRSEPRIQRSADPTGVRDLADALAIDNNFNLPGIPAALLRGDFNAIPDDVDTRAMISSYLRIINENCGEQAVNLALSMFQYALNNFRDGLKPLFLSEGFADARYLVSRIGCVGNPFNTFIDNYSRLIQSRAGRPASPKDPVKFAALMSPAFRARNNIPDPSHLQRERALNEATKSAEGACVARYSSQPFCRCVVQAVRNLKDEPELLKSLAPSFDRIVALPVDLSALEQRLLACESGAAARAP
jgi:hypothetical protein